MPAVLYLHFLGNNNDSVDLNFFRMMAELFILLFLTLTSDVNILILVVKCVNMHIYIYVHLYFHMHIYIYTCILIPPLDLCSNVTLSERPSLSPPLH